MPTDQTTYRFACDICGDVYSADGREDAIHQAESCEGQGLEAEPLPPGTSVLTSRWNGDGAGSSSLELFLTRIAESSVGSGARSRGAGHQVNYRLEGEQNASLRPRDLKPHQPERVNTRVAPRRDNRTLGDHLHRLSGHLGASDPRVGAAAALLSLLSGRSVQADWAAAVLSTHITHQHPRLRLLPPRQELPAPLREAIDTLARPIADHWLSGDALSAVRGRTSMRVGEDEQPVRPQLPVVYQAAWTLALDLCGGRVGAARAFMLSHRDELPGLLSERSAAWWADEPVALPGALLEPAEATKSGDMTAVQRAALLACADVQMEPRRRSSLAPEIQWRDGAIRVLAAPPTRANQKKPRYRPVDALAGLLGHHPDIRSLTAMIDSHRPPVPVVCVASGKGGVGKSTVAAALAMGLTRAGSPACVLDLDLEGPSLPALLDLPAAQADGARLVPHTLADGTTAFSPGQLFGEAGALTWDQSLIEAMTAFLAGALDLDDRSVLVVDLPPGTSVVQQLVNKEWAPAGTILVTTGSRVAHADLRRSHAIAASPLGLVENLTRAQVEVDGRQVEARLYDGASTEALAGDLGLPYLGSLPHRPDPSQLAGAPEIEALVRAVQGALSMAA